MSRQFVDMLAPDHLRLRQIGYVQEHGLLLPNVIFCGDVPATPLPDQVREGAAADPECFKLKVGSYRLDLKVFALNLEVFGRSLAAIGYLFVFNRLPFVER